MLSGPPVVSNAATSVIMSLSLLCTDIFSSVALTQPDRLNIRQNQSTISTITVTNENAAYSAQISSVHKARLTLYETALLGSNKSVCCLH